MSEKKQIGVKINSDLWRELRKAALDQDRTATELLEEAIQDYIEKHRRPRGGHLTNRHPLVD